MSIKPLTEKGFMRIIIQYARLKNWLVYHTYDSRKSEPGFPDLVLTRNGITIFVELKLENKFLTLAQKGWIEELTKSESNNLKVYIWRPNDWSTIEKELT